MLSREVSLFNSKNEIFLGVFFALFIAVYSLLIEFNNYKNLTKFDSNIIEARVLKQYKKVKNNKTYQVLKCKAKDGFIFYTTASKSLTDITNRDIILELWAGKITFYEYMSRFYAFSKIIVINQDVYLKNRL